MKLGHLHETIKEYSLLRSNSIILISLNWSNKHVLIKNKKCTGIYIYIIALLLKCDATMNETNWI